jgi:hypothetical protein
MNQDILCNWLDLPKTAWPPDPWTLLGLPRGEQNLSAIEDRVQDRMTKLRHYQLSYPEEATEGMNRLAEAFITLTQACNKAAVVTAKLPQPVVISKDETAVIERTKLDWRDAPPPVRQEAASSPEVLLEDAMIDDVPISLPFVAPAKMQRRQIDPILACELAQESDEATSEVGTIEAVIERVDVTRRLLHAWEKVGKCIKAISKKTTPKESETFAKRLQTIADIMQAYPAFLGHPGKPGYRVVVQARLKMPLSIVRAMTAEQREELLVDWQDGFQVLVMHRKYLRKLFKSMRRRSTVGLVLHAVRAFLNDHPRLTLIGMVTATLLALIVGAVIALK